MLDKTDKASKVKKAAKRSSIMTPKPRKKLGHLPKKPWGCQVLK
jgi:hypothetical protein